MKQYVEVIKDSFSDFAGKEHQFVVSAVTDLYDESDTSIAIMGVQDGTTAIVASSKKGLHIGISICNPEDKFDEKTGVIKATARAKNSPICMASNEGGLLTPPVIKAILNQVATYIKENPGDFIKGYEESKAKYLKKVEMEHLKENFSEVEKIVVANVEKDPRYLDNVNTYLAWISNKKQKCKKAGK